MPRAPAISVRRLVPAASVTWWDVVRAVRRTVRGRPIGSISVVLAGAETMARLHQQYMNDPSPTDVLSFDLRDDPAAETLEGEVVVCVDIARREAKRRRLANRVEILRYVIHGTLHLLGYDDATPAQRRRMRSMEDAILTDVRSSLPSRRA